jgi:hypothetical protein
VVDVAVRRRILLVDGVERVDLHPRLLSAWHVTPTKRSSRRRCWNGWRGTVRGKL